MTNLGHNNPPDPIDEALSPYGDYITEAENWLDGEKVETEGQMKAVDALTKQIKAALKDVNAGEKSAATPLYDTWKAEKARWKPTIDDLGRIRDGLIAAVSGFKAKLAAEKKAAEKAAWEAANKARREAEEKAAQADAADIEAQRDAANAAREAIESEKAAKAVKAENPKGMRKVSKFEIENHREVLQWIAANDRDALTEFIEAYVSKNHKTKDIDGAKQWITEEAF